MLLLLLLYHILDSSRSLFFFSLFSLAMFLFLRKANHVHGDENFRYGFFLPFFLSLALSFSLRIFCVLFRHFFYHMHLDEVVICMWQKCDMMQILWIFSAGKKCHNFFSYCVYVCVCECYSSIHGS